MAQPPTVTHMPMAKPKYSLSGFLTVATERTTKASTKVKNISARIPPTICTPMYIAPSLGEHLSRPEQMMAVVTAGLKCAPEQVPKAKIIHISDAAIENAPAAEPLSTLRPTVSTSM